MQPPSSMLETLTKTRCGPQRIEERAIAWQVWAPLAQHVQLVVDDGRQVRYIDMEPLQQGYFRSEISSSTGCRRYAYRLNHDGEYPDPCSRWQPDGVHSRSALYFPEKFRWTDQAWRGLPRRELVFYEMHVGTFTPSGTFEAIIERLPALRELGITALEIMPVSQFPGERNWGYDGVFPYAVQNSYGGPEGLQKLVDAAHREQLAVFLDVVYNHFGPEGNYLHAFGPYFTGHYRTAWGSAINYDGPGSDAVRAYVLDNARMWLEDYHLDGLRLDAVHAIYDLGPNHILADIERVAAEVAEKQNRQIEIVAESDLNDPRLLRSSELGGYNLDAQWSDDFHHAVHAYLTGEKQGYYADFGSPAQVAQSLNHPFIYQGQYSAHRDRRHGAPAGDLSGDRFVIAIQNHDQVGNRAQGERLTTLISPPQQRLAASLLLLSPHLPLLFMGEEYGETHPFQFFCSFEDADLIAAVVQGRRQEFSSFAWQAEVPNPQSPDTFEASRITWSWPAGSDAASRRRLYHDLLQARRVWPVMENFVDRQCQLLGEDASPLLRLLRGKRERENQLEIFFNLSGQALSLPSLVGTESCLLFSSESAEYQGTRAGGARPAEIRPYECLVYGPADWPSFF